MINIKRDENLAALVKIIKAEEPIVVQAIIDTIDPFVLDDFLAGMTLEKFINEIGYTIDDFLGRLQFHTSMPVSALDSTVSEILLKLKFWYEGADDPCKNCGYEIMWNNDDMAVTVLEGSCPMCHQAAIREL